MYQAVGIGMWEYLKQFKRQLLRISPKHWKTAMECIMYAALVCVCDACKFIHQSIFTPFDPRRVSFAQSLHKKHYDSLSLVLHLCGGACNKLCLRTHVPP